MEDYEQEDYDYESEYNKYDVSRKNEKKKKIAIGTIAAGVGSLVLGAAIKGLLGGSASNPEDDNPAHW